ncbi:MAG: 1-deoxy-D-xylulose-5-phosphate synthase [Acidobacteriota bacterium]
MSSLLENINTPEDLKKLKIEDLEQVAREVREYIIDIVSERGGHLAASLGVVELSIALHYIFDCPRDKFIWDVGHQGYAHKILTGRREEFRSLRQYGGLSGFIKMRESPYDSYGTGHASTSISAALGMAVARDLNGEDYRIVAITGDGAMTGGLAYEGLNNAGHSRRDLLVILNDNEMSISRNVGAISHYLTTLTTNPTYKKIKTDVYHMLEKLPRLGEPLTEVTRRLEMSLKSVLVPASLFQSLGFSYYGPIDGHDLKELIAILTKLKTTKGPILLHVLTKKGKGYAPAENSPIFFHGVPPFDRERGEFVSQKGCLQYTDVFGKVMVEMGEKYKDFIAVTAAMSHGTGLEEFRKKFPERFFDVGIAEAHAVTFAAGAVASGIRPVVAIYSTFLQRAFDPIIHDVALQGLPVIFAVDRAGIVGADGATHNGNFDLSYLRIIPGIIIAAPKDGNELRDLLDTALNDASAPFVIRYPRDTAYAFDLQRQAKRIDIGSWELVREGKDISILAVGSMVLSSLKAADGLKEKGIDAGVVNCRFIKPMDERMLREMRTRFEIMVTVEENSLRGGFGEGVCEELGEIGLGREHVYHLGIPDSFIEHGGRGEILGEIGLTPDRICSSIENLFRRADSRGRHSERLSMHKGAL